MALLRTLDSVNRSPSTLSFAQYREAESQNCKQSSVTSDGELLDVLTLELRVHPPNVSGQRAEGWLADAYTQSGTRVRMLCC